MLIYIFCGHIGKSDLLFKILKINLRDFFPLNVIILLEFITLML